MGERRFYSVKAIRHSSIVGGGTMLLDADGRCIGQSMIINVNGGEMQKALADRQIE